MSTVARLSVRQFDRMMEGGVFDPLDGRRFELIHGEVREMSPIGDLHAFFVDWLNRWCLRNLPFEEVWVRIQSHIPLPSLGSAPQPDILWLRMRDYRRGRPSPDDVFLVIEVSDSSLRYDRDVKGPLYAQAGIQEYWIVNLEDETIEIYRQPMGDRYGSVATLRRGEAARSLAFPDAPLALDDMFGVGAAPA